ncbi:MAG: PAS domain S-box protein [Promethearchaeota archaeon]
MSDFDKTITKDICINEKSNSSVKKFQRIFEAIPDLYFLVDNTGKHLDFKGNEDILFLTPDLFLGKTIEETLPKDVSKKYYTAIKKTLETKKPTIIEYSLPISNITHHYEARSFYFSKNRVAIFVRDITEKKNVQEELLNEKKFTETALNAQRDTFFVFEPTTLKAIRWNKAFSEISGYADEEIAKMKAPEAYYNEQDLIVAKKAIEEIDNEGLALLEMNLITKKGNSIPFEYLGTSIKDEMGKTKYIVSVGRDITDRLKAEQKLKESEDKFRTIAEQAVIGIAIIQDNHVKYTNQRLLDYFGYTKEEVENWPQGYFINLIHPDFRETSKEISRKNQSGEAKSPSHREVKTLKKNGEIQWTEFYTRSIIFNGKPAGMNISIDITERKKAEQNLKKSEIEIRKERDNLINMLNSMEDGVYIINQQYEIEYVNPSLKNAFGPVENKKCYEYFQNISKPCPWCKTQENIKSGSIRWEWDSPITNKFYEIIATPIKRKDGTFSRVVIFHDITKRKKATNKLKKARERADMYLNLAGVILVALSKDGTITLMNKKGYKILEYEEGELDGQNWFENCVPSRYKEQVFKVFMQLMKGQTKPVEFFENPIRTKNGMEKIIAWHNTILYDKNGNINGTLSSGEDITERKKAEKELKRLSKLKSELLTRTSHELKTPAMHIKGFADLLLHKYKNNLGIDELQIISHIKKGVLRLETLIYDIMHKAELELDESELNKARNNLSSLIELSVKELRSFAALRGHSIKLDIDENMVTDFNTEQIRHVLNNLITNAIKYTPLNGIIGINSTITDDFITIAIQDNGIGITEEQKERLFTQFGKIERYGQGFDIITEGSGLGLYIAKKIIDLHDGKIWVESGGINRGSTFYFSLPKVNE